MSAASRLYDRVMMDHIKNARNFREMADATASAEGVNPLCGDSFRVYVRIDDDTVRDAAFQCECCGISMASASMMTESVKGRSVADARRAVRELCSVFAGDSAAECGLDKQDARALLAVVREFPSRINCARLAWLTLEAALDGLPMAVIGDPPLGRDTRQT